MRRVSVFVVLLLATACPEDDPPTEASGTTSTTSTTTTTSTGAEESTTGSPPMDVAVIPTPCDDGAAGTAADPATGHCFGYQADPQRWEDAQLFCEGEGGHLATFSEDSEVQTVSDLLEAEAIGPIEGGWIGLIRESAGGEFEWVTAEPLDLTHWGGMEPDADGGNICAYASKPDAWLWHDTNCNASFPFVCEWD